MRCYRCKVEKDEGCFDLGQKKCQACCEKQKAYYNKNRSRAIERAKRSQNKDRKKTNAYKRDLMRRNPVSYMLWSVKARAKKSGLPFDLTHEDIVVPEVCPILGIKLEIGDRFCSGASPSVDRIIPGDGYVRGNIQVISHRANTIKSDANLDELRKVVAYLEKL